jgi:hypothetical protein
MSEAFSTVLTVSSFLVVWGHERGEDCCLHAVVNNGAHCFAPLFMHLHTCAGGQGQGNNPPSICGDPFQATEASYRPLSERFWGYESE